MPTGNIDAPYGPFALAAIGGDPPLEWTVLDMYGEELLDTNEFTEVGVAQGWQGGNDVWDYALPFAFPFYGEWHTTVKIAADGWINFGDYVGATYSNSEFAAQLQQADCRTMDNLRTDNGETFSSTRVCQGR